MLVHVVDTADHAAGPVFEIHVERHAVLHAVLDGLTDVVEMLIVRLLQLLAAMMQRAFGQQVDDARADRLGPVDRPVPVDEAQNLDSIDEALRVGVVDDGLHGAALAFADRADATSMRSTLTDSSRRCAMVRFSSGIIEMPSACSPSRSVVSITSIRRGFPLPIYTTGTKA